MGQFTSEPPWGEVNPEDVDSEILERCIQDQLPEAYATLSETQQERVFETIRRYVARRQPGFYWSSQERRPTRIDSKHAAARAVGVQTQSIDNSLQLLYDSSIRTPNEWFETDLELINIAYSPKTNSWFDEVTEQFYILQNMLLDLASLDPPGLDLSELDPEQFIVEPEQFPRVSLDDRGEQRADIEALLEEGRIGMNEERRSFYVDDVRETDTGFGALWREAQAIVGAQLEIPDFGFVNGLYAGNDFDNVRFNAYGPSWDDENWVVKLSVRYYPTGTFEVEAGSTRVLGGEQFTKTWHAVRSPHGEGFPLEANHIRGFIQSVSMVRRSMDAHLNGADCIESDRPWVGKI